MAIPESGMSETGLLTSQGDLEQMRCQPAEGPDAQGVPFAGRQPCLRNIVTQQLDPAIIAVSEVRQLPVVIGQRAIHSNISRKRASNSGAITHPASLLHDQRMQKHLCHQERDNRWKPRNRLRPHRFAAKSPVEPLAHIF